MRKTLAFAFACLLIGMTSGCTKNTVNVVKNPDASDTGIRYYRPKPYLLVTPADPTGRLVNMKIEYHPDFSEEYSVHPRGKKTQIALKDGWNLVGVNAGPAPPPEDKPPAAVAPAAQPTVPDMVVAATNVPLGYYESVIGNANGQKYFQGWRYLGFSVTGRPGINPTFPPAGSNPNCPPAVPTSDLSNEPLYGMVFFNGVQTFRQINEIGANQLCPTYVPPYPKLPGSTTVAPGATTTESTPRPIENATTTETGTTPPPPVQPAPPPTPSPAPPTPSPAPPGAAAATQPKATDTALLLDLPPLPRP